jgi:hypothetical protein
MVTEPGELVGEVFGLGVCLRRLRGRPENLQLESFRLRKVHGIGASSSSLSLCSIPHRLTCQCSADVIETCVRTL